jgi:uncharacterized protein
MLHEKLDELIANAIKNKKHEELEVLRSIKNEFIKYLTAKAGNKLDDVNEASILIKMVAQRNDSINQFKEANRQDLVDRETNELEILKQYAPKEASNEEIEEATRAAITVIALEKKEGEAISMKDMKGIMEIVKSEYPTANGKIVSKVLNDYLKK